LLVPMLQQLAKDVQEYIMSSEDWTKCMQYIAGQRKPSQLYLTQSIEVEVLLSEAFDRLELPNRIDEVAWEGFKGHTIYVAEGIEKEMRVGLDLPQVAVIYTPPPIPGGPTRFWWSPPDSTGNWLE